MMADSKQFMDGRAHFDGLPHFNLSFVRPDRGTSILTAHFFLKKHSTFGSIRENLIGKRVPFGSLSSSPNLMMLSNRLLKNEYFSRLNLDNKIWKTSLQCTVVWLVASLIISHGTGDPLMLGLTFCPTKASFQQVYFSDSFPQNLFLKKQ